MSERNAHASMTKSYRFCSNGWPKSTLSRNVAFATQAFWGQYDARPFIATAPAVAGQSPRSAERSVDLPLPVGPYTTVSWLGAR